MTATQENTTKALGIRDDLDDAPVFKPKADAPTYTQPCPKCRGTGSFTSWSGRTVGPCFICKGTGTHTFKTKPEYREKARAGAQKRKQAKVMETLDKAAAWKAENADLAKWLETASLRGFNFAISLSQALLTYGHLTENQIAAARKCIAKDAEFAAKRQAEQEARAVNAPAVSVESIETALNTAKGNGLKSPKLRLADFTFSLAKATSKNAGAIYVKDGGEYLGKIAGGKFFAVRECGAEREAKVAEVASKPADAAVAYGRMTGSCACCGRELTDPESVARGIGPVCATHFGF